MQERRSSATWRGVRANTRDAVPRFHVSLPALASCLSLLAPFPPSSIPPVRALPHWCLHPVPPGSPSLRPSAPSSFPAPPPCLASLAPLLARLSVVSLSPRPPAPAPPPSRPLPLFRALPLPSLPRACPPRRRWVDSAPIPAGRAAWWSTCSTRCSPTSSPKTRVRTCGTPRLSSTCSASASGCPWRPRRRTRSSRTWTVGLPSLRR